MKTIIIIAGLVLMIMSILPVGAESSDSDTIYLNDVKILARGKLTTFEGNLYDFDKRPLRDRDVEIHCMHGENEIIKVALTNSMGYFSGRVFSMFSKERCEEGDNAWVETKYGGKTYISDTVPILGGNSSISSNPNETPEFSIVSVAITVILGCLGVALLRKN